MIPFIVKITNAEWKGLTTKKQLSLLLDGPFSLQLQPYLKRVDLIYQTTTGLQLSVLKDLSISPHGQMYGPQPEHFGKTSV